MRSSDQENLTAPDEKLSWIASELKKVVFIPVGANLSLAPTDSESNLRHDETPTVAVFGVTGGVAGQHEISQITAAVRFAAGKIGKLRLLVFGRNAESAQTSLEESLR